MKRKIIAICAGTFLFVACNNETKDAAKSDKDTTTVAKAPEVTAMPDSATMMKNWMFYATPGDMHKMLAKSVGAWDMTVTTWEDPSKPPTVSTGTTTNKMIMDGRFQETNATGNMMGMPFMGHGITGYDNAKKMFVSIWIDNMTSGIMNMEGPWDEATKTINLKGQMINAGTLKPCDVREVFKIVDDNNQVMEMYTPGMDGKEMKMMEIKYTRKK